jgi:hypothetical protein
MRRWVDVDPRTCSPTTSDGDGHSCGGATVVTNEDPDESGAILILALIYIVTISLVVAALATWATNDLNNTTKFASASSIHYAASGATEAAIQAIRYNPIPYATPPKGVASTIGGCWPPSGSTSVLTIDQVTVTVWCISREDLNSPNTRVVDFYTCLNSVSSSSCEASPIVAAVVDFNDYPPGGLPTMTMQCNFLTPPTCGNGITLMSWDWNP